MGQPAGQQQGRGAAGSWQRSPRIELHAPQVPHRNKQRSGSPALPEGAVQLVWEVRLQQLGGLGKGVSQRGQSVGAAPPQAVQPGKHRVQVVFVRLPRGKRMQAGGAGRSQWVVRRERMKMGPLAGGAGDCGRRTDSCCRQARLQASGPLPRRTCRPAASALSYIAACSSSGAHERSSARSARPHSCPTQGQLRTARAYTLLITAWGRAWTQGKEGLRLSVALPWQQLASRSCVRHRWRIGGQRGNPRCKPARHWRCAPA